MSCCQVGRPAPDFALDCIGSDTAPHRVALGDYAGRWLVLVFYPRDFSFICPTELTSFSAQIEDFKTRDCELLGVSVDSLQSHQQWLSAPPSQGGLGPLRYPLAADSDGAVARAYGVWSEEKQVSMRGLFLVDPAGVLQYMVVHNLSVGRRPDVVLRVLDALRTGGLCPSGWTSADGTLDPERALQAGRVLGRYQIRERLGSGTFGSVFAAWDLRLSRMVALKILKRKIFESREIVLAEARAAAALSSPYVCTIYTVDEEDGLPLIAMEYLDGPALSTVIEQGLDRPAALRIAIQIARGLAAAHQEGVVHGDLKPANVILTAKGVAKIVDFGLARPANAAREAPIPDVPDATSQIAGRMVETVEYASPLPNALDSGPRQRAAIQGTPAYMAPEQARAAPAPLASDVFSFALILYEMLTGRPAHPDRPILETLLAVQSQDLGPQLAAQVEPPYRELFASMLAHDAAVRPAIGEVLEQLVDFAGQSSPPA
ncbi:MAG: redoxin domain-containing protein [Pirellulales bacterium]|nr:redoxin domain-containing protein [Pirellulales bacterium]